MKGIALCLPGGFSGLPAHVGALHELFCAVENGTLPSPEYICTSSAGGIAGSISLQDSRARLEAQRRVINLKKSQFARLNPEIRNKGVVTVASTLGLLVPTQVIRNRNIRFLATLGVTGLAFWAQKEFVKSLFKAESFLTYDRLYELLLETLNFDQIFSSPVKIEIPCVNINKAGWTLDEILSDPPLYLKGWKNKGWVSVTNFRPEDVDLPAKERNERFAAGIVHGARIFGMFRPGRTSEGDALVDTAAISNMPVHFAIDQGYDKIIILYYNRSVEAPSDEPFNSWVKSLNRSVDISVSEKTRRAILGYMRTNHDLDQVEKMKESLSTLEKLIGMPRADEYIDSRSQQTIRRHMQEITHILQNLSYSKKKKIRFLFIRSRPLPNIHFGSFTRDEMIDSMNCGAEALRNAIPDIQRLYAEN